MTTAGTSSAGPSSAGPSSTATSSAGPSAHKNTHKKAGENGKSFNYIKNCILIRVSIFKYD